MSALIAVDGSAQANPPASVKRAAAAPVGDLSMTDNDAAGLMRWVVWSNRSGGHQYVELMLFRRANGIAIPVWSTVWADAYAPKLRMVDGWSYDGHSVLAVTKQFGAAAMQVSLFGLAPNGPPVLLGEEQAAWSEWTISVDGKTLLALFNPDPTALKPTCVEWDEMSKRLSQQACP